MKKSLIAAVGVFLCTMLVTADPALDFLEKREKNWVKTRELHAGVPFTVNVVGGPTIQVELRIVRLRKDGRYDEVARQSYPWMVNYWNGERFEQSYPDDLRSDEIVLEAGEYTLYFVDGAKKLSTPPEASFCRRTLLVKQL